MSNKQNTDNLTIEYKLLKLENLDELINFCRKISWTDERISWISNGIKSNPKTFVVSAELVNGTINGIIVARTYGNAFTEGYEALPLWLGIRADRLNPVTKFTTFMDNASKLLTDLFESRRYFQHYIIIKLPPTPKSDEDIARRTKKLWAQGPYHTVVENVVRNEDDFNKLPIVYKRLMGNKFTHPVAILFMNMTNENRDRRIKELAERNYVDPL